MISENELKIVNELKVIVKEALREIPGKWKTYFEIQPETFKKVLLSHYNNNNKTVEFSKIVNPNLDRFLYEVLSKNSKDFKQEEINGSDFIYKRIPFELKTTNCKSNNTSWTGNQFKKTNWHLLLKYKFDTENIQYITSLYALFAPLDECANGWKNNDKSHHSGLNFKKEDQKNLIMIYGKSKPKNKIIHFEFEEYEETDKQIEYTTEEYENIINQNGYVQSDNKIWVSNFGL